MVKLERVDNASQSIYGSYEVLSLVNVVYNESYIGALPTAHW